MSDVPPDQQADADDFGRVVTESGRIKVRHSSSTPLPLPVSAAIAARVHALRHRVLPQLDAELGVRFPFVVIEPVCWTSASQGVAKFVHGTVAPTPLGNANVFSILISAASLLSLSPELTEGLLCDKFLFYAHESAATYDYFKRTSYPGVPIDLATADPIAILQAYRNRDPKRKASVERWLPERLRVALARLEDENDSDVRKAHTAILSQWVGQRLPTIELPRDWAVDGDVLIDVLLVDRHRGMIAPDPALKPFPTSARWVETSPSPILDDLATAVLMVRIGMANNALTAQFRSAKAADDLEGASRMAFSLAMLVNTAALTNEAIQLMRSGMPTLRRLALAMNAKPELLDRVGSLMSGRHEAAAVLARARNKLGFHWDEDVVAASVCEYGRNRNLVWVENARDDVRVDRLAVDVLTHALIPESDQLDTTAQQQAVSRTINVLSEAMNIVLEFVAVCTFGYLRESRADRRESPAVGEPTDCSEADWMPESDEPSS